MKNTKKNIKIGLELFINDFSKNKLNLGLVSNSAAIMNDGRSAWKAIIDAGFSLKALFGPEHGFLSIAQDAVKCMDSHFQSIPVFSLYGERKRPDKKSVEGIDALVFDIQDIGCRYYTYVYTLAAVMESCIEFDLPLIVLDRPNPVGGLAVEGSPIPPEFSSFVGNYALCPRYGMTIGEVSKYYADRFFPKIKLEVVKMEAWKRDMLWKDTNLPWHLPSPNLPTTDCAIVYPGTCLFEGTWMSEGRGTAKPFEMIGAPWIEGEKYREEMQALNLAGVVFSSLAFSPNSSKHKAEVCEGLLVNVIDPYAYNSLNTGIAMLHTAHRLYPKDFKWRENWETDAPPFFDSLAGGPTLRKMIERNAPLAECLAYANEGRDDFIKMREKFLLY